MGTWQDPALDRPIVAPLQQCAELLGIDLATIQEAAANVEPYICPDGTRVWSRCSWSGSSGQGCTAGGEVASSTADERGSSTYS